MANVRRLVMVSVNMIKDIHEIIQEYKELVHVNFKQLRLPDWQENDMSQLYLYRVQT